MFVIIVFYCALSGLYGVMVVSQPSYQRVNASKDEKTAFCAPLLAAFVPALVVYVSVSLLTGKARRIDGPSSG